MRRCLIISVLMVLVSSGLPLKGTAQTFPEGSYRYTPTTSWKVSGSSGSVSGNVSTTESIIGSNDLLKVRGFSKNSAVYKRSRKVAFVLIDRAVCTGFLVGPDLLLTNHHCVFDWKNGDRQRDISSAGVFMEYYDDSDHGPAGALVKSLLKADKYLDYALLRLDRPLGATYGWLNLKEMVPREGDFVEIIQHPAGRSKEIANYRNNIVDIPDSDFIHYIADTERGSSGSPVFWGSSDDVIALHHKGGRIIKGRQYPNEGVLMRAIVPEIRSWLPGGAASSQGAAPSGMVLIPAGEFQMGSADRPNEQPVHTVHVDAFYMDKYEVTNAEFQRFVLANPQWQKDRIRRALHDGDYLYQWNGNNYPTGKANHPVTYVSWYAAVAYAKWAGKRLPTEAEWEKAARGGRSGLKYPWGNGIDAGKANYDSNVKDTTPVGRYGANGYGLYDMSGNVWEWCLDAYDRDFYSVSPYRNPVSGANSIRWILDNYTNVKYTRVLRGGSWNSLAQFVRCANRLNGTPSFTSSLGGFRCARSVTP